jgi:ribosomal protein S18 acetylase RimI-like enzyme
MQPDAGVLRLATADDAAAVAALHALSWQSNYRGSLSDAYLDGPILAERDAFWRERLAHPRADLVTLLLEIDGRLAGFVCALMDHDPRWGTLVDNLHVDPALKGRGLGRRLMRALGDALAAASPGPVYLYLLASNAAARAFYLRIGGEIVEHMMKEEVDGSVLPVERVAWPSLPAFRDGTR